MRGNEDTARTRAAVAWHALTAAEALRRLGSDPDGLDAAEAAARLARDGPNELPLPADDPLWRLAARQLRSAVAWLLLAGMALSLAAGDRLDAVAIAIVLALNVAIGVAMEAGAHRALRALRTIDTPRAIVLRGGAGREVDARTLVVGDVIALDEGALVPADARIIEATDLRVVEAALTGEPVPVAKRVTPEPDVAAPLPERLTMLYRGTPVVAGAGHALVVATGPRTELGRLGLLAEQVRPGRTPLERKLDALGAQLAVVSVLLAVLVAAVSFWRGASLSSMLQLGIALAVATVPEGLPVVATIAMALGVHRMARRRALVRRLPSVETLGSTSVVCADKTGTLTAGAMTVSSLWCGRRALAVTGAGYGPTGHVADGGQPVAPNTVLTALGECAALTVRASVEERDGTWSAVGDPTDAALAVLARKAGVDRAALRQSQPLVQDVPFSSTRRHSASLHRASDGRVRALVKGAPRLVLGWCDTALGPGGPVALGEAGRAEVLEANRAMAARGERVIALAAGPAGPGGHYASGLTFLGLAGMTDPPAEGVRDAVGALRQAGVRPVMITGDQRATADAIAASLDILRAGDESIDARALSSLDDVALRELAGRTAVFSRVSPEDKLRIVAALQERGAIVAMLGDGVNDAPALRRSDVGVAMGRRGTDVAREAADVVLQDDRFPTVVAALEEGRVIYDNLRKFVYFLASCNLAEMLALVAMPLLGWPVTFTPLQLLWLNLVTDVIPALALAAEPADLLVMRRPPRPPRQPILSGPLLRSAVWHAALLAAATLAAFQIVHRQAPSDAATAAFLTLAVAQCLHLGNARSASPVWTRRAAVRNPWAVASLAVSLGLVGLTVALTPVTSALGLRAVGAGTWVTCLAIATVPALLGQSWRAWRSSRRAPAAS